MRTAFSPIARQSGDWRSRGRASAVPLRTCRLDSTLFLLGTGAAKADYEAGCQPDIVLVSAEERCASLARKNISSKPFVFWRRAFPPLGDIVRGLFGALQLE